MGFRESAVVFSISLTGIPVIYILNNLYNLNPFGCFAAGIVCYLLLLLIPYLVVRNKEKKPDNLYYVLAMFMFGCVIDIVMALENDGFVSGFTAFYLQLGESYFRTSHGTMLLYWDGTVQFGLYITMLAAQTYSQTYREVGLYWCGSIINSLLILLPSAVLGEHGLQWSYLLNVPFTIIPISACINFLRKRPTPHPLHKLPARATSYIWQRPVDLAFVVYLILAAIFALFRGLTVLDAKSEISENYIKYYEPYLTDRSAFPKLQMLVYMFYFIPFYVYAAMCLVQGGNSLIMSDLSILHAGASAQGQFSHMGASLHSRTPFRLRVPHDTTAAFLLINGALFLLPHLLLIRTCISDAFIEETREEYENVSHDSRRVVHGYSSRSVMRESTDGSSVIHTKNSISLTLKGDNRHRTKRE